MLRRQGGWQTEIENKNYRWKGERLSRRTVRLDTLHWGKGEWVEKDEEKRREDTKRICPHKHKHAASPKRCITASDIMKHADVAQNKKEEKGDKNAAVSPQIASPHTHRSQEVLQVERNVFFFRKGHVPIWHTHARCNDRCRVQDTDSCIPSGFRYSYSCELCVVPVTECR